MRKWFHCTPKSEMAEHIMTEGLGSPIEDSDIHGYYCEFREALPTRIRARVEKLDDLQEEPTSAQSSKLIQLVRKHLKKARLIWLSPKEPFTSLGYYSFEAKLPSDKMRLFEDTDGGILFLLPSGPIPPKMIRLLTDKDFGIFVEEADPKLFMNDATFRRAVLAGIREQSAEWVSRSYAKMAWEKVTKDRRWRLWNPVVVATSAYTHMGGDKDCETTVIRPDDRTVSWDHFIGIGEDPKIPKTHDVAFSMSYEDFPNLGVQGIWSECVDVYFSDYFSPSHKLNLKSIGLVDPSDPACHKKFLETLSKIVGSQKTLTMKSRVEIDSPVKVSVKVHADKSYVEVVRAYFGGSILLPVVSA